MKNKYLVSTLALGVVAISLAAGRGQNVRTQTGRSTESPRSRRPALPVRLFLPPVLRQTGVADGFVTVSYPVGQKPVTVATGDFNLDGHIDLVTANVGDNTVSVLLGNGDGTFQPAVNYSVGTSPSSPASVVVGDFNGDGAPDLAVTSPNSNVVGILLNAGDGTFQSVVNYAAGPGPFSVTTGDFNRDGKLDLAVVDTSTDSVGVLLGHGDGSFLPVTTYPVGGNPQSIATGDFNGDGNADLAVAAGIGVSVLLGVGDGTFNAAVNYAAGSFPEGVAVGDFNQDGRLDLAVANFTGSNVSVLLGVGDGTFNAPVNYAVGAGPASVATGDFNSDGKLDLVTSNAQSNTVSLLLGNGDGSFQAPADYNVESFPVSVTEGDFNGDNLPDLAVANSVSNSVSVLVNIAPPAVNISPTSLTFGNQLVATTSKAQNVTLTNAGGSVLSISSITSTGDFGQTNTCGSSVAPGASCTISVTFTPTSKGIRTGTVSITDNANGSPQTVSLKGTGTVVSLSAAKLNFGTQEVGTRSSPLTVTLTNKATKPLNISAITITGTDSGDFAQTNTCGAGVAGGRSCNINVTFKPTATGSRSAAVSITDNGGGSPQKVALSGTGT